MWTRTKTLNSYNRGILRILLIQSKICDIFQHTKIIWQASDWISRICSFSECKCLMPSSLFTSSYNVMSSLKSVLCLDNKTTRSETSTKTQCIFC